MKMIKKFGSITALLLLLATFNGYSMEPQQQKMGWVALAGAAIIGGYVAYKQFLSYIHEEPTEALSFTDLPFDKQHLIVTLLAEKNKAMSLQEAAKTINSLAQTDKYLNELINDPEFCLHLIKQLAINFECSDETAAMALHTKEAIRRLGIQKVFLLAVMHDYTSMVIKECEEGIDLDFTYYYQSKKIQFEGLTVLMVAALNNDCHMIELLLSKKADINKISHIGNTALKIAVTTNNTNAVQCLLKNKNIAINQQDNEGWTALLWSLTRNNRKTITKQLLEAGADPELATFDGLTPLQLARRTGDQEVIDLIQDAINRKHGYK